ncbi:MAG TPA: hypothetical protein VKD90_23955 [Gemmataceae bacterium]|nr:hypothetical protein [Gemmataceae bacterium]
MNQILPSRTVAAMLDRARDGVHFCPVVDVPVLADSHEALRARLRGLIVALFRDTDALDTRFGGDFDRAAAAAEAEARRLTARIDDESTQWSDALVLPAAPARGAPAATHALAE